MDDSKTYNGWTNYETWNVALWCDNDQGSYNYWREQTEEALDLEDDTNVLSTPNTILSHIERATRHLAEVLCKEVKDGNPLIEEASLYSDILSANLSEVNWDEIAKHWIEEVVDNAETA